MGAASPYGVVVEGGHDFHQPFRFPGHWADPETGLHYNRFRYYSPDATWSTESQVSTLAHEVGHALHGEDPHIPPVGMTPQDYVESNRWLALKNEGDAQINAAGVADEIVSGGGPQVPVPGEHSSEYREIYDGYVRGACRERRP